MKCVCPMGGDRTCPDDCPLAIWANLSPADRKAQRKAIAEQLYKQGFTMEQIATQLAVAKGTISKDLAGIVSNRNNSKPTKTASNPKGAGRPKGSGKGIGSRRVNATPEEWDRFKEAAEAEGKSAEAKLGDLVREPEITLDQLSFTAQQKLEIAARQHKAKLDANFRTTVLEEVRKRIDEIVLPHWKEQIEQSKELFSRRRKLMDKKTFDTIRRALHPDSRNSISDKKLGEAFDAFMGLEKYLLDEKDSPTDFPDLPRSWQEWETAKRKTTEARKARYAANKTAVRLGS
jgi:hypothetical protein